uniref:Thioredoxin 2 n=1 Tax=Pipistrellus kuhlii TaxID=59472 RepID=A0A7J7ZNN9_PIPKU|nr:thioredoxin 2 [Pipistrellus kuhlii]
MAQRLLLRRFLASAISRKPPQSRWAPLISRALQTPQHRPGDLAITPSQARPLHTTRVCSTTFNIQDGPDFQDRVVNSETPVVVDFHAQCQLCPPCWPSRTGTWWTSLWASRMRISWRLS